MRELYYVYSTKMSPGNLGVFSFWKRWLWEEFWRFTTRENGPF